MPTQAQLDILLESDVEFKSSAAHGFGSEHVDHIPAKLPLMQLTGKCIGDHVWDAENEDIKIDTLKDDQDKPQPT